MATIKLSRFNVRQHGGAVPYGNATVLPFTLVTTATGAADSSDTTAAIGIGDVIDLGPLPEGFTLNDSQLVISTALTAAVTGSLGFKYEDGIDSADVPQDAAYFGAGIVMSSTARLRNASTKAIVKLPKPARLILTVAGAANTKVSKTDFLISGVLSGPN